MRSCVSRGECEYVALEFPLVGPGGRARVALDANALIPLLEAPAGAAAGAVRTAMAGRSPVVSIHVVKEFLKGGCDKAALRGFLQSTGGSVGRAANSTTVEILRSIGLREGDARAVGSAIREGVEFLTRDRKVLNKGIDGVTRF